MDPERRRALLDQYRQAFDMELHATDEELERHAAGEIIAPIGEDHGDYDVHTSIGQSIENRQILDDHCRRIDDAG